MHANDLHTLVYPVVNLNGTSRDELVAQNEAARVAVRAALEAVNAAAPHGRDYQTAAPGRYQLARAQHKARVTALQELQFELTMLAENLLEGGVA